jgi:type II secretory pathway component PulF
MPVFRFKGLSSQGKLVQNEFEADSKKEAKAKVEKFAKSRNLRIQSIDMRQVFMYKVEKEGKVLNGEQEAYTKEELEKVLIKLGYKVKSINKQLFDIKPSIPNDEIVNFIRLSGEELMLISMVRANYSLADHEYTCIVHTEEQSTRVLFMKGTEFHSILPVIAEGRKTTRVLRTIFSKILFEVDRGKIRNR